MIAPSTNETSSERAAILAEILRTMPGNDCETQRNRLLTTMQRLGSVTSYEGSRCLDCYDPRARIYELRLAGYRIKTVTRPMPTESGVLHYMGVYICEGPPVYPLLDGIDEVEVPTCA